MATWEDNWDEEYLKNQSAVRLREIYVNAPDDKKENVKKIMMNQLHSVQDFKQVGPYDLLSYLKVAEDADLTITDASGNARDIKNEVYDVVSAQIQALEGKTDLVSYLQRKALLETAKIAKNNDSTDVTTLDNAINGEREAIENELNNINEINDDLFVNYDNAETSGALEDVSQDAKDAFINKLAKLNGWDKVEGRIIEKNDNALNRTITSLDAYDSDNKLTDLYSDCQALLAKVSYEFPDDTTAEKQQELTQMYNQQLLVNSAHRATQELLKNRSLLLRCKTNEDIKKAYKEMIAQQFERSVVLAGLATSPETGVELSKIVRNSDGDIEYQGDNKDSINTAITDILDGNKKITPAAVNLDTWHLQEIETRQVEKIIGKKANKDKMKFWKKSWQLVKNTYSGIVRKGGWKKIAVNGLIYGGAAAMMAGPTGMVAAGALIYAGWTSANAWLIPVYDTLSKEMHTNKIKGLKNKIAYIKANWSRAKKDKYEEEGFKSRAWWRTGEGLVIGGLSGGIGFVGATGSWTSTFLRQGTMVAGKAGSLIRSLFKRKSKEQKLLETYSVSNYKSLQTAESYLKQDKIALGGVIVGAVIGDTIKANSDHIQECIGNIKAKLNEAFTSPESSNGETVVNSVVPLSENSNQVQDFSNVELNTNNTSIKVVNDSLFAEAEINGLRASVPVEYDSTTGKYTIKVDDEYIIIAQNSPKGIELTEDGVNLKMSASDAIDAAEPVSTPINMDTLSNDEKAMYLNSIKKWDNNALENRIAEMEKNGIVVDAQTKQSLVEAMGDNQVGKGIVQGFYDKIVSGKVESCPQGVNPIMYIDKLTRLAQLAPVVHKDAIGIMIKDLSCDEFVPNAEQIALVNNALNTIVYQKGSMECIIPDADGNLCLKTVSMFGQYTGEQQMAKIEINGEIKELPLRTANETTGLHSEVDCGQNGVGKVVSTYVVHQIPGCGCNDEPIPAEHAFEVDQDHVVSGEILKDNREVVNVNFADPKSFATAVYANNDSDYAIEPTINGEAQYIRMDNDGNVHLWQQGATVAQTELLSGTDGVETIHQTALNLNMDKLGAAIINDGEKLISFQYGEGKHALSFVLNKENGEMHTYIGKVNPDNEVILDQATTQKAASALTATMRESNLDSKYNFVFGEEAENNNDRLSGYANEFADKKADVESEYNQDIQKGMAKASEKGVTTTHFDTPDNASSWQSTAVTPEQQAALLSDQAKITSTGEVTGGQMIFEVEGVDGLDKFSMPAVRNFTLNPEQQPQVVADLNTAATSDALHKIKLEVPSANGNNIFVEVDIRGSYVRVFDENGPVLLDKSSSENIGNACMNVLNEQGLNVTKLNLNPYPEGSLGAKCVGIYNQAVRTQQLQQITGNAFNK